MDGLRVSKLSVFLQTIALSTANAANYMEPYYLHITVMLKATINNTTFTF